MHEGCTRRGASSVPAVLHSPDDAVYEVLDEEGLSLIEHNADTICKSGSSFAIFRALSCSAAGVQIDGQRVASSAAWHARSFASAPREFTQHARNPAKSVKIGGDAMVLVPPAFSFRARHGRRSTLRPSRIFETRKARLCRTLIASLRRNGM